MNANKSSCLCSTSFSPSKTVWGGCLLLFGLLPSPALAEVSKEYRLKAAFLYNFTKFVEWPRERFADETTPIVIRNRAEALLAVVDGTLDSFKIEAAG